MGIFYRKERLFIKRIIAIIFALTISVLALCLVVSADSSLERQVREEQLDILNKYCEGDIDYDTYITKSNELTQKLYDESTVSGYISSEAEQIGNVFKGISNKIGATAQEYGDKAYMYIADNISGFFDDYRALGEIESPDNPDMQGYGAVAVGYYKAFEVVTRRYYADYINVAADGKNFFPYSDSGVYIGENYDRNGNYDDTIEYNSGKNVIMSDSYIWTFYGDVRYEDGSKYPTNEEYIETEILDFSDSSDVDLDKLLNEILEELERSTPDLSSVEGLLESIYFRLGSLDKDNDNALLSQINAAIVSLTQSNETKSGELILKLDELKEALKSESTTETDISEITEELKKISNSLNGLLALEVVDNVLELTEAEQQLFDEYANLIPLLVDKVGLAIVQQTMVDIESVIFTSSAPSDLKVEMYGGEYTILSQSMFTDETMRYINLAKTFISVILIYSWCMSMRKNLAGGDS